MIFCRKQGYECVKFTRRRREAMQEHNGRGVLRASLPVENPDTVYLQAVICRRGIGRSQRRSLCHACKKGRGKSAF